MVTKRNYNKNLDKAKELNLKVSEVFLELINAKKINLVSVGNSISSGYSKCDEIIPFLKRSQIFFNCDSNISFFSFARVRRNEDANILKWYSSDLSNEELLEHNIDDIEAKKEKYANWNGKIIDDYKTLSSSIIGFKTLNINGDNIIIYNGLTGNFTNKLRKGEKKDKIKILSSFREDLLYFEMILRQIYIDNPQTQVYVCGLPNVMGIKITSFFDKYIKEIIKKIPNAVYVPGVVSSPFFLENQKEFDVHYSKPEYINLWNNITQAINNNYYNLKLKLAILSSLEDYSQKEEQKSTLSKGDILEIEKIINKIFDEFINYQYDIDYVIDDVIQYYDTNYLSTFPCTPRMETIDKLNEYKMKLNVKSLIK